MATLGYGRGFTSICLEPEKYMLSPPPPPSLLHQQKVMFATLTASLVNVVASCSSCTFQLFTISSTVMLLIGVIDSYNDWLIG